MNRSQRGFTLIELMVALVVSSLLVGMILAIFNRMSIAYRGQQQIAGVQQVLAAARATIELDAKQAGLELSQGFKYAVDGATPTPRSPIRVIDSSTGPDQIFFYYADPTTQAAVLGGTLPTVTVDASTGFAVGNLVVMSRVTTTTTGINAADANLATYDACVLKVTGVTASPAQLTFDTNPPWGLPVEDHCTQGATFASPPTMIYKFVARAYKIDTSSAARAALGPLQLSETGGLIGTAADNWTDLAYGFTDIQTALQVFDRTSSPGDSADIDADPERDWYSDVTQNTLTAQGVLTGTDGLLQMSISLVARTDRNVEGVATAATPQLIDPAIPNNNTIGNHASVVLPSATDPALGGSRIYRFTTFVVDLRNLGVGR